MRLRLGHATVTLGLLLPLLASPQEKGGREQDKTLFGEVPFTWTDPYGRYALELDGSWVKRSGGFGPFGEREFSQYDLSRVSPDPQYVYVNVGVEVAVHSAGSSVADEVKNLEANPFLIYGEVLSRKDSVVHGKKARIIEMKDEQWDYSQTRRTIDRTDYVLILAEDYVLSIRFTYLGKDAKQAGPVVQGFLDGVRLPDRPLPPVSMERGRVGFQVAQAVRVLDAIDPELPAGDPLGLVTVDKVPDGWKLLRHRSGGSPLEGLAFEKAKSRLRVYLCPLWVGPEGPDPGLNALRDMRTVFQPLRGLPPLDPPKGKVESSGSETFHGKLGDREGKEGRVWRFLLKSGSLSVLVICAWEGDGAPDPRKPVEALLQGVRLYPDRLARLPGEVHRYAWVDHFTNMTEAQAKLSKLPYSYIWKFGADGGFRRESYAGADPKRVAEEGGKCALVNDRFLYLIFQDGTMEILPLEIWGDDEYPDLALDFRNLHHHDGKKCSLHPWSHY